MLTLERLQERRARECRLDPSHALRSLDDAELFLRDRGLLTRTADSALPSLFEACHEEPYAPNSPGFGQWPATRYPWFGQLGERGYLLLGIHRGKNLLVTNEVAALVDPICRAEIDRMASADAGWRRLLGHLADAGPSDLGELQAELGLRPKELKQLRSPLVRCGAVVARSAYGETGAPTTLLARWDQAYPEPSDRGGLPELVVAGVRAAVVAPEAEIRRWFSWQWYWTDDLLDRLVDDGRLVRPEPGWVAVTQRRRSSGGAPS